MAAALTDDRQKLAQARVGAKLKGWRLKELLGLGPTSAAYEAYFGDDDAGEHATIKLLLPPASKDERARSQFLRAAYAANRFRHPRVVSVSQDGTDEDGAPFIVRPWHDASPLEKLGTMEDAEVLRLAEQVLDALEIAHAHGIVHGAISPANILVTPKKSVRLVDFAIPPGAATTGADEKDALAALRVGPFTPPERATTPPSAAGEPTDVWALAACMYYALTGKPPATPLEPVRELAPKTGELVAQIVEHALNADPALRYDSAYAMLGDVRRAMAGRKPKLTGALRPVPSGSYRELPQLGAAPSSRRVRALSSTEVGAASLTTRIRQQRKEWRGNVVLILAIAFLVGVATFVMVREKRSEEPVPESPAPAGKMLH